MFNVTEIKEKIKELKSRELWSNIVIAILVGTCALIALLARPTVDRIDQAPPKSNCPAAGMATGKGATLVRDTVSSAKVPLVITVDRSGFGQRRETAPLPIQNGKIRFAANTVLCMTATDFVRSDGLVMPASQVTENAIVSNNGDDVTILVWVAPRYQTVSGFGSYSGTVSLNDSRATGGSIPVQIFVQYPYINLVLLCGLLLAYAGLIWGLLVRRADKALPNKDEGNREPFFANLALRIAVLATAVPIINAQVLSKSGWTGTLSQYIKLGGLVGAAAIAATPTFRAFVSRLPGNGGAAAVANHEGHD